MLPGHTRQYSPVSVPNGSFGPGVLDIFVGPCIYVSGGGGSGSEVPAFDIFFLGFVHALSKPDERIDGMDARTLVRAPLQLFAAAICRLSSSLFGRLGFGRGVFEKKKGGGGEDVRSLPRSPIQTLARVVVHVSHRPRSYTSPPVVPYALLDPALLDSFSVLFG